MKRPVRTWPVRAQVSIVSETYFLLKVSVFTMPEPS